MSHSRLRSLVIAVSLALAAPAALSASFVYEGRLDDLGQPANGRYDLKLSAFGDPAQGVTLAAPVTFEGVLVKDGRFRLDVDLPLVKSDQVWLEVAVRGSGEPTFASIPGRSKAIAAPLIGACWSTMGDSGSNPATNFLGTTDAQPLELRTANVRSLRIEPSTVLFNGSPITTNTIGGSSANTITAGVRGATIAGGGVPTGNSDPNHGSADPNRVTDNYGTVGGGYNNQAGDGAGSLFDRPFAAVGGGRSNSASGGDSTVGGGFSNTASGGSSTVGGGRSNTASGFDSTVGGGLLNTASGLESTVGGGFANTASGSDSTVSGGLGNCAGGAQSWAGGNRAKVRPGTDPGGTGSCSGLTYPGGSGDAGTFVWADSQFPNFVSTGDNQFLVRANGAVRFQAPATDSAAGNAGYFNVVAGASGANLPRGANTVATFESNDNAFLRILAPSTVSSGILFGDEISSTDGGLVYTSSNSLQFRTGGNIARMTLGADGVLTLNSLGAAGATALCRNASNQISTCSSSARYKQDIADLQLGLETALRLHAVGYRWKEGGAADVGFVAEEIAEIDERLITRNEQGQIEGVKYDRLTAVLANAVQELAARDSLAAEKLRQFGAENAELKAESTQLRARLDRLEAALMSRTAEER